MDISTWLHSLGLSQYEQVFRDNAIDVAILPKLTAEDLKELGVALVGHRRKLLDAITALQVRGMESPRPPSTQTLDRMGERRQVTVLFADLAGYTALSNQYDAEDIHSLLGSYFQCVDHIIEDHGGWIDKHIGDCVMAVFGAPIAHDNDAERAVRAGLAIRDAMPQLSSQIGVPLDIHIGIAGGQVVASLTGSDSHGLYTVTGDTVNLASRLTASAVAGDIIVSNRIHRALSDQFDATDAGSRTVKGFDEPVPAWRVHGLRPVVRDRWRFIGRQKELHQFQAALAACRDSRRGQTLFVRGEAGIGKTRLVEEVQHAAKQTGFLCHMALVLDFGTGRDAIRSLMRSLLEVDAADGEGQDRMTAAFASGLVASSDAVYLNDLLDLPQPTELRAVFDAMDAVTRQRGLQRVVARVVDKASRRHPCLLVVEDLHWADNQTLTHLTGLTDVVAQCPALLVMTSRFEGNPLDREWWAEIDGRPLTTIDLGPLQPDEARILADEFLAADDDVAQRCVERAAGNPLFLEQLLRHADEGADVSVPDSVQSLVQARLDRLRSSDRAALQAAAVLGQRFGRAALAHLLDRTDCSLEQPVSHLMVRPLVDGDFLFAHALVRDAIYDTLLKSRRRALHRRAADWYADRDLVLRAEHLDHAADREAARAYLAATRSQADEYRYETALRLVERGLALATDRADRFALACLHADILHDLGAMPDAARSYRTALDAAADDTERCSAWIGLAAVKRVIDDLDGALADLRQAEEVASRHQLTAELARVHFLRGNLCFPKGDIDGCLQEHGKCLDLARQAGAAELEAMALGGLGDAEYMRGRMMSAHERFRACIAMCQQHSFGRIQVANRPMMAFTRYFVGDARGALDDAVAAIAAASKVGHQRAEMIGHHVACFCAHVLMDFAAAQEHAEISLALARQLGARRFEAEGLALCSMVHRHMGKRIEAIAEAREAVDICRETGPAFLGPFALSILASVTEDPELRKASLEESDTLLRRGAVSHNYLLSPCEAIDVCLAMKDWDTAERYAAVLEDYAQPETSPFTTFYSARARILAAFGRGRADTRLAVELKGLRDEGERIGQRIALIEIDRVIVDVG